MVKQEDDNLPETQTAQEQLQISLQDGNQIQAEISLPRRMSLRSFGRDNARTVELNSDGNFVNGAQQETEDGIPTGTEPTAIDDPPTLLADLPVNENYKPQDELAAYKYAPELADLDDQMKELYFQPDLPKNDVLSPTLRSDTENTFYLLGLPDAVSFCYLPLFFIYPKNN